MLIEAEFPELRHQFAPEFKWVLAVIRHYLSFYGHKRLLERVILFEPYFEIILILAELDWVSRLFGIYPLEFHTDQVLSFWHENVLWGVTQFHRVLRKYVY